MADITREEAINIISQMIKDEEGFLSDNTVEAHKIALKALEREPILEKIRTEIYQLHCHPKLDFIKTDEVVDMALDIIDKYK